MQLSISIANNIVYRVFDTSVNVIVIFKNVLQPSQFR